MTQGAGLAAETSLARPELPELSVCLVTRDGGQGLLETLRSLDAAAAPLRCEALVVDNASRDGTPERIAAAFPDALVIRNARNRGFAQGCNQAAARARGEVLVFLNDDALPTPGSLAGLAAALEAGVAAAGPRLETPGGVREQSAGPAPLLGGLLHRVRFLRWTRLFRAAHRAWRRAPLPQVRSGVERLGGAALAIRRGAAAWDEGYPFGLEDVDLCRRLARQGRLLYCPDLVVIHEGGRASAREPRFVLEAYERGYARYLKLHDPRPWAGGLYKLLVTLDGPWRLAEAAWRARRPAGRGRLRAEWAFYLGGGLLRFWRA